MISRFTPVLLVGCALLSSCAPAPETTTATTTLPPWKWDAYPQSNQLLLATLPATLEPARSQLFRASTEATLEIVPEILAAPPGTVWPANTIWARLHTPSDAVEDRELDRASASLAEREAQYRNVDLPAARIQLDGEIATAADTLALARLADRQPALFRSADSPIDPHLIPTVSTATAAQTLNLLQTRRAALDDPANPEPAEIQALRAEVARRTRLRDERRSKSDLKLGFAATLLLATPSAGAEHSVAAGELLAIARDWTRLRLRLRATMPELHGVPAASLSATVTPPGGKTVTLAYASTQLEARTGVEEPIFYFETSDVPHPLPPTDIALSCVVNTRLATPARIVPKLDLAARDQQGALLGGWSAALPVLLPGAELVAEGRANLALRPVTKR